MVFLPMLQSINITEGWNGALKICSRMTSCKSQLNNKLLETLTVRMVKHKKHLPGFPLISPPNTAIICSAEKGTNINIRPFIPGRWVNVHSWVFLPGQSAPNRPPVWKAQCYYLSVKVYCICAVYITSSLLTYRFSGLGGLLSSGFLLDI